MGNSQIGYDISPYAALRDAKSIAKGLGEYLKHLEDNRKEVRKRLDNFYEDLKAVWKLTGKDDWIKSVKKEFKEMKILLV